MIENEHLDYCKTLKDWDAKEFFKTCMKRDKQFAAIITGSSKAGKSNILRYILAGEPAVKKYFDFILVFSRTLINGFYQSFIDGQLFFPEFDGHIIGDFKKIYEQKSEEGKPFKWLVILDDIVDNRSKYNKEITDLFYCGRHYGASIVFLTQKLSLMATGWLSNSTIIITLFCGARAEKEYIADRIIADVIDEAFANKPKKRVERIAYLIHSNTCQNYQALIILPYEREGRIFKFKAPLMKAGKKKDKPASIYMLINSSK
jgi:hypothetical protein